MWAQKDSLYLGNEIYSDGIFRFCRYFKRSFAWVVLPDPSAPSKTINLPEDASVTEVAETILEMWNLNLKGGTIYRDKSKLFQILNKGV